MTSSVLTSFWLQVWAVEYYVSLGAPREKLIVGVPTYGRGFKLSDASDNGYGAPTVGACDAGTYTKEAGYTSYYEVLCFFISIF